MPGAPPLLTARALPTVSKVGHTAQVAVVGTALAQMLKNKMVAVDKTRREEYI